jgi:hypothetical protein
VVGVAFGDRLFEAGAKRLAARVDGGSRSLAAWELGTWEHYKNRDWEYILLNLDSDIDQLS